VLHKHLAKVIKIIALMLDRSEITVRTCSYYSFSPSNDFPTDNRIGQKRKVNFMWRMTWISGSDAVISTGLSILHKNVFQKHNIHANSISITKY